MNSTTFQKNGQAAQSTAITFKRLPILLPISLSIDLHGNRERIAARYRDGDGGVARGERRDEAVVIDVDHAFVAD